MSARHGQTKEGEIAPARRLSGSSSKLSSSSMPDKSELPAELQIKKDSPSCLKKVKLVIYSFK